MSRQKTLWLETLKLRFWCLWNVPMLFIAKPKVVKSGEKELTVMIPLRRQSKNHLGSMYMGALVMGADIAAGLGAIQFLKKHGICHSIVFKDIQGSFLKRPESNVYFNCQYGDKLQSLKNDLLRDGGRKETTLTVIATCPQIDNEEIVAEFKLTLSVKKLA